MEKKVKISHLVEVKIRPAKWQDFKNASNPCGVNVGMTIFLGTPEDGLKAYRLSEVKNAIELQKQIKRGLLWVPCTGFDSHVRILDADMNT